MTTQEILPFIPTTLLSALFELAEQINAAHNDCERAMNSGLQRGVDAGQLLLKAKRLCTHGEWMPWVTANCRFPLRTVQLYMRIAREVPKLDGKCATVAHLSLREGIGLVADNTRRVARLAAPDQDRLLLAAEDHPIKSAARTIEQAQRAERRAEAVAVLPSGNGILTGDFREVGEVIPNDSVDLIFTDPPYDAAGVALYSDLTQFAKRVLRPGGLCLAYAGHWSLPRILALMENDLEYIWTFAVRHTRGMAQFYKLNLHVGWKPVVAFVKPSLNVWWPIFTDIVSGGGREKTDHDWQQAVGDAEHFISILCPAGGNVVDPFCGSGTTLVAAKRLGRKWLGIEIDSGVAASARKRIEGEADA